MEGFARVNEGLEKWIGAGAVPRHIHNEPYAAVVVAGGYEECGSRGRFRVHAGDVLAHAAFDAHLDRFHHRGATIVNIKIAGLRAPLGRVTDPEAIAQMAARDPVTAGHALRDQFRPTCQPPGDWPDLLADDLLHNPDIQLDAWADDHGLAAETLSRGFRKVFGVTPAAFRLEARIHRALAMLQHGRIRLSVAAAAAGFADQAHMSRAIRTLTGHTPSQVKFVQDRGNTCRL